MCQVFRPQGSLTLQEILNGFDQKDVVKIEIYLMAQIWELGNSRARSQEVRNIHQLCRRLRRRQQLINHLKVYADLQRLDNYQRITSFDFALFESLLIEKIQLLRESEGNMSNSKLELRLVNNDLELNALMQRVNFGSYCQPYNHSLKQIIKAKSMVSDKLFHKKSAMMEKQIEAKKMVTQQLRKKKAQLHIQLNQLKQVQREFTKEKIAKQNHEICLDLLKNQPLTQQVCSNRVDFEETIVSLNNILVVLQREREGLQSKSYDLQHRRD